MIKKISIKEINCYIKTINNVLYISDMDANRVINLSKSLRGRKTTKEKLCDLNRDKMVKLNGIMFYPVNTALFDDCLQNKNILE